MPGPDPRIIRPPPPSRYPSTQGLTIRGNASYSGQCLTVRVMLDKSGECLIFGSMLNKSGQCVIFEAMLEISVQCWKFHARGGCQICCRDGNQRRDQGRDQGWDQGRSQRQDQGRHQGRGKVRARIFRALLPRKMCISSAAEGIHFFRGSFRFFRGRSALLPRRKESLLPHSSSADQVTVYF